MITDDFTSVSCIYKDNPTSADKLCDYWCKIQQHENKSCIECPDEYQNKVEHVEICNLHEELELLKDNDTLTNIMDSYQPVVCKYEEYQNDSDILCNLWCSIQKFSGNECIICPESYINDLENVTLCNLNQANEILNYTMSGNELSENPLPVDCPFQDNPTSSMKLCDLWCEVIQYNDSKCIECPNEYVIDPESGLLCNLYSEIEKAMHPTNIQLTTAFSGIFEPIICEYKDHPTSSDPLCNLWCQLEKFDGKDCIICPEEYQNLAQTDLICQLNEELKELEYTTNKSESTTTVNSLIPVECQYKLDENSKQLCEVWCQIQELKGYECIQCPEQYLNDPERQELCDIHAQLILLQEFNETKPFETLDPIQCKYENNPTSAELLCNIWCDTLPFGDSRCIKCPSEYMNDPENVTLCDLYADLEMAKYPSNIQITTAQPGDYVPVSCPYKDNPTSSSRMCNLWCELQLYSGKKCIECPYENDPESEKLCELHEQLQLLAYTPFDPATSATSVQKVTCAYEDNPTSADLLCNLWCKIQAYSNKECIQCPEQYKNDPKVDILCDLHEEYVLLNQSNNGISPTENLSKVICQYENDTTSATSLCDLWCKIQPFKGNDCIVCPDDYKNDAKAEILCDLHEELTLTAQDNDLPVSNSTTKVVCEYENDETSAEKLCNIWCEIEKYSGNECIICPEDYIGDPKEELLCDLNEELVLKQNTATTPVSTDDLTPVPCKYANDDTSSDKLCSVWCDIQLLDGKECINCPDQYLQDPEKQELCSLHETLTLLAHNKSLDDVMPLDLDPVVCKYKENPTSADSLCNLWCQIQQYNGQSCIICPNEYKEDPENETLCNLYEDLQLLGEVIAPLNPSDANPVVCVYNNNPTSSDKLCNLWCQIETYSNNSCIICPAEYESDPAANELCQLHESLELLKGNKTLSNVVTDLSEPVVCEYSNHTTSKEPLCDLWCQIEEFNDKRCIICPDVYAGDTENTTLCKLNEDKEFLEFQNQNGPVLDNPYPVTCPYSDNPTSANILCDIWCNNALYNNTQCVECPDIYKNDPKSSQLCDLYTELQIAKHPNNLQLTTVSTPTPVRCLYQEMFNVY